MNAVPKSRDLAKQETREALIQAGMDAFSEEGVDLPSLDAICARAGFTRGAFYVHFKDREDFFAAGGWRGDRAFTMDLDLWMRLLQFGEFLGLPEPLATRLAERSLAD